MKNTGIAIALGFGMLFTAGAGCATTTSALHVSDDVVGPAPSTSFAILLRRQCAGEVTQLCYQHPGASLENTATVACLQDGFSQCESGYRTAMASSASRREAEAPLSEVAVAR